MKSITQFFIILISLVGLLLSSSCKTKEEALPNAMFSLSFETVREGDTLIVKNESTNYRSSLWEVKSIGFQSKDELPTIVFKQAGSYELSLTCYNGDNRESVFTKSITVLPDTVYRLSNNWQKKWIVRSIIYGGNEMLKDSCQKDDEFTVFHNDADTCTLTEGKNSCAPGTYIFDLPATSQWRFNSNLKAFEFALFAFGSPINLSFNIKELSHTIFKGTDVANGVSIWLEAAP